MFNIFKRKPALLTISLNGQEFGRVDKKETPCEKNLSVFVKSGSVVEFIDDQGVVHRHELGVTSGWYHFSVRVHSNLGCQIDCVITDCEQYDSRAFDEGNASGIRFQPFFISGAEFSNEELFGKGLFARGLHFSGTVTSGRVILSCECDDCHRSFQIHSYHAGFSNSGYFYSASGRYTITVSDHILGAPVALSTPDPQSLADLESKLPLAPDGTSFRYTNSFRCPHCGAPYIDFEKYPEYRSGEYYGNYFVGEVLLHYEPQSD